MAALFATGILLNSCGTIMGKRSKVALVGAPTNLIAKADGEGLEIKNETALSRLSETESTLGNIKTTTSTYSDYYSPTVRLNKQKKVLLELASGNDKGSVELNPKFSPNYFLLNLFLTGPLGIIVDVVTKNQKQHTRFVDVPAVLAGKPKSEWRSKHKLKKAIKRGGKSR